MHQLYRVITRDLRIVRRSFFAPIDSPRSQLSIGAKTSSVRALAAPKAPKNLDASKIGAFGAENTGFCEKKTLKKCEKWNYAPTLSRHNSRSTDRTALIFAPIDSHESQLSIGAKTSSVR